MTYFDVQQLPADVYDLLIADLVKELEPQT